MVTKNGSQLVRAILSSLRRKYSGVKRMLLRLAQTQIKMKKLKNILEMKPALEQAMKELTSAEQQRWA